MAQAWRDLGSRRFALARQVYVRDSSTPGYTCPRCGRGINWRLPYKNDDGLVNVRSKSVDHVDELQDGGSLADLDNLMSVHLGCNSSKGATRRHERVREARSAAMTIAVDPTTL